jgi:proteic killer suppression protein
LRIVYDNKDLEKLCLTDRLQKKQLGQAGARKLRARLADLMAAARVSDLIAGHPHPLTGDRAGQSSLRLDGGRRLVFEPEHDPFPLRDDGSLDWSQVTAVRILFIGDYHD